MILFQWKTWGFLQDLLVSVEKCTADPTYSVGTKLWLR